MVFGPELYERRSSALHHSRDSSHMNDRRDSNRHCVGSFSVMHAVAFCWFMVLVVPQSIHLAVDFSTESTPALGCPTTKTKNSGNSIIPSMCVSRGSSSIYGNAHVVAFSGQYEGSRTPKPQKKPP